MSLPKNIFCIPRGLSMSNLDEIIVSHCNEWKYSIGYNSMYIYKKKNTRSLGKKNHHKIKDQTPPVDFVYY